MSDYPTLSIPINHVEPVPRRIRGVLAGETVVDSTRALYVWETPYYPQYYFPVDDVHRELLIPDGQSQQSARGQVELHGLQAGSEIRPRAAKVLPRSSVEGLSGTVRFDWAAMDSWFEEDERVYVHPRNPFVRVDALRSSRKVRVELEGHLLAESRSPVMVFETGLPTRYYLNRCEVDFEHLRASDTETSCPYKGTTSGYWSAHVGDTVYRDVAWAYDFPTRELLPITGLIAFFNEKVDIILDGQLLERPSTPFSR